MGKSGTFFAFIKNGDFGGKPGLPAGGNIEDAYWETSSLGSLCLPEGLLPPSARLLLLRDALFSVSGETDLSDELSS